MANTLWKDTTDGKILGEFSGGVLQWIYYDNVCCCNIGADCTGKCDVGTTPAEVDFEAIAVPVDLDNCLLTEDCDWLEGQTFRMQQEGGGRL